MLKLGSLVLLSPLAYFFGNEYKKRETDETAITTPESTEDSIKEIKKTKK